MAQWDAFISYARSASTLEATHLQTAIQTFAKPWHLLRAVRIFRDDSSMSANPALWSTIEQGLREARWLVVLLSPIAARSEYVANEIRWWLQHKDAASILLVHDEGTLGWDRVRNDFSDATDCVPAPLRGAFREEPRWSDLSWFDAPGSSGTADPRFRERVADLASAIRGIPRDELLGDDVAQHRRSWRLAKLAIGGLSLLLIASIVASVIAVAQRNEVLRQANALLARQLAATADSLLSRDLRRAQLLAVRAYRTDPTPETRAALLRASLASPALRRILPFGAPISQVEAAAGGRFVAVGLESGEVFSWDVATATPIARFRMGQRISAVGISDDGAVLAAADGAQAYVDTAAGLSTIALAGGQRAQTVAVNPSGRGIVVGSDGDRPLITVVDLVARQQRTVADPAAAGSGNPTSGLQFVTDDRLLVHGSITELRSFPAFARISGGASSYGSRELPGRGSGDGRFATATNGDAEVPVWAVGEDRFHPARYAFVPMTNEAASALNHDATLLALADADGLHLATVRDTGGEAGYGHSADPPQTFTGLPQVSPRGLLFLGTTRRLVAAAGSELSLWDPDSVGRSATSAEVDVPFACTACRPPIVELSPDGGSVAIRVGTASTTLIGNVPGESGGPVGRYSPAEPVGDLAPPVWLADGTVVQLASGSSTAGGTLDGPLPGLPDGVRGWAIGRPDDDIVAVRVASDGAALLAVTEGGWMGRYDVRTGRLLGEARAAGSSAVFDAGITPDLATVALLQHDRPDLVVLDSASAAERYRVGGPTQEVVDAAFGAGSLWVRYASGEVARIDPAGGEVQRRLPGRFSGYQGLAVADSLLAILTDTGVTLYDIPGSSVLGNVDFPTGWRASKRGAGLNADGSRLVTVFEAGSTERGLAVGTVLDAERLVGLACRTSGGSLSAGDWQVLVGGQPPDDLSCR
jgi:antiphage defense system Thoeris ThsB-like protein